jgi:hypothetical protein
MDAAKKWQYKPATRAGSPVQFTKRIRVLVNPGQAPTKDPDH